MSFSNNNPVGNPNNIPVADRGRGSGPPRGGQTPRGNGPPRGGAGPRGGRTARGRGPPRGPRNGGNGLGRGRDAGAPRGGNGFNAGPRDLEGDWRNGQNGYVPNGHIPQAQSTVQAGSTDRTLLEQESADEQVSADEHESADGQESADEQASQIGSEPAIESEAPGQQESTEGGTVTQGGEVEAPEVELPEISKPVTSESAAAADEQTSNGEIDFDMGNAEDAAPPVAAPGFKRKPRKQVLYSVYATTDFDDAAEAVAKEAEDEASGDAMEVEPDMSTDHPLAVETLNPFAGFNAKANAAVEKDSDKWYTASHGTKRKITGLAKTEIKPELPSNLVEMDKHNPCYPEYLEFDKRKRFPMTEIYLGDNMYRGRDRPEFKVHVDDDVFSYKPTNFFLATVQVHDAPKGLGQQSFGALNEPRAKPEPRAPVPETEPTSLIHGQPMDEDESGAAADTSSKKLTAEEKEAKKAEQEEAAELRKKQADDLKKAILATKFVKMCYNTDTQVTSVCVQIELGEPDDKGDRRKIWCEYFASCLERDTDYIGLQYSMGEDRYDVHDLPQNETVLQLALDHDLARLDLELFNDTSIPVQSPVSKPVWRGISWEELNSLCQRFDADDEMSDAEKLVVLMYHGKDITFFQHRPATSAPVAAKFASFIRSAMYACANMGPFWWYSVATAIEVDGRMHYSPVSQEDFPFRSLPYPRWLVTEWNITYDAKGNAIDAEVAKVENMASTKVRSLPDTDTNAFALRLAEAREAGHSEDYFRKMTATNQVDIKASFIKGPDGLYIVALTMSGKDGKVPTMIPQNGTKITIAVNFKGRPLEMKGEVVEDAFETDADYCALVRFGDRDAKVAINNRTWVFAASVDFPSDIKAATRARRAVEVLQAGQDYPEGPYLPSFALGAPLPEDGNNINYIQRKLEANGTLAAFNAELDRHQLTPKQLSGPVRSLETGKGVFLIWGPAGTGKSRSLVALLCAFAVAGVKVLVCGPTNKSVTSLARAFAKAIGNKVDPTTWCRFTGALSKTETKPESKKSTEPIAKPKEDDFNRRIAAWDVEVEEDEERKAAARRYHEIAMFQQMAEQTSRNDDSSDIGFSAKKLTYLKALALSTSAKAEHIKKAEEFLEMLDRVLGSNKPNGKKLLKEERASWVDLETATNDLYIKLHVGIVFVTNNSAAHATLVESFRPESGIMDEAGLANAPDTMVPLAAFKDWLCHLLLAGDHHQMGPIVTSKGMNEVSHVLERSLFQEVLSDRRGTNLYDYPSEKLDVQFRQTPVLSLFPRTMIYHEGGELKDAPSVLAETDLQKKVKESFQPLIDAGVWNGRERMCIDPQIFSQAEAGSTSALNKGEADAVARFAYFLIKQSGVLPEQILVVTPYLAQAKEIREYLNAPGDEDLEKVPISATYQSQGSESRIVLLSLVQHLEGDDNHLGFIGDAKQVTVEITRAQDFMVVFGNFKGWRQAIFNGKKTHGYIHHKNAELFKQFIEDCLKFKDVMLFEEWRDAIEKKKGPEKPFFHTAPKELAPQIKAKNNPGANKRAKTGSGALDMGVEMPQRNKQDGKKAAGQNQPGKKKKK